MVSRTSSHTYFVPPLWATVRLFWVVFREHTHKDFYSVTKKTLTDFQTWFSCIIHIAAVRTAQSFTLKPTRDHFLFIKKNTRDPFLLVN